MDTAKHLSYALQRMGMRGCENTTRPGRHRPDKPGANGKTPLFWAAYLGYEGVVKMLLGRGDVNPNKLDGHG